MSTTILKTIIRPNRNVWCKYKLNFAHHQIVHKTFSSEVKLPVLTLYTKHHCPLCDVAKEVLKPAMARVQFEEVDIEADENKEWWDLYKYDIPVFHLNGQFLMKHKANLKLLNRQVDELETS